ncbi:Mini-ribonuclease 3 [Eupransor demetentiae]|uniref:Mini-ribonuclease 3 n=1 Tax=Eupransor demetentiae TaxID=3109584 RepID=A0ABM9N5B5_9LACO|nr:23S rRNA maturation mini-RNase III (MrnC) [Lactobacillaceae bacterium LMG 33000]
MNGLSLAYIGDAVYEVAVRKHLLELGFTKVNAMQKHSRHYVSAKAHAAIYAVMEADGLLKENEMTYFKRGRNAKSHTSAKHTEVIKYRISTGIEAMFGYLYLSGQMNRFDELMNWIFAAVEDGRARYE